MAGGVGHIESADVGAYLGLVGWRWVGECEGFFEKTKRWSCGAF